MSHKKSTFANRRSVGYQSEMYKKKLTPTKYQSQDVDESKKHYITMENTLSKSKTVQKPKERLKEIGITSKNIENVENFDDEY